MTPFETAGLLAHARSRGFGIRRAQAWDAIVETYARCASPCMSWSAGKDSSVLLHLVLQRCPTAHVHLATCRETRMLHPNLDDVIAWWRQSFPEMQLREVPYQASRDGLMEMGTDGTEEGWFVGRMAEALGRAAQGGGHDGVLIGLRADESNARRLALKRFREPGQPNALYRYAATRTDGNAGLLRACPLERWSVQNVGAYIAAEGLPLLSAYEWEGLDTRTTMRLCPQALQGGALSLLRRHDGAAYNALLGRFPDLAVWA